LTFLCVLGPAGPSATVIRSGLLKARKKIFLAFATLAGRLLVSARAGWR
jgi:hypothetical protein